MGLDLGSALNPGAHRRDPPIRMRARFPPGRSTLVSADLAQPGREAAGEVAAVGDAW